MPLEVNLKPIKHISLNVHKIHSQSGCGLLSHQNIFQTFRTGYVGSASNRAVHLRIWKFPISNATIHTAHWTAGHIELWTHPSETTPMNVDLWTSQKENQQWNQLQPLHLAKKKAHKHHKKAKVQQHSCTVFTFVKLPHTPLETLSATYKLRHTNNTISKRPPPAAAQPPKEFKDDD